MFINKVQFVVNTLLGIVFIMGKYANSRLMSILILSINKTVNLYSELTFKVSNLPMDLEVESIFESI